MIKSLSFHLMKNLLLRNSSLYPLVMVDVTVKDEIHVSNTCGD